MASVPKTHPAHLTIFAQTAALAFAREFPFGVLVNRVLSPSVRDALVESYGWRRGTYLYALDVTVRMWALLYFEGGVGSPRDFREARARITTLARRERRLHAVGDDAGLILLYQEVIPLLAAVPLLSEQMPAIWRKDVATGKVVAPFDRRFLGLVIEELRAGNRPKRPVIPVQPDRHREPSILGTVGTIDDYLGLVILGVVHIFTSDRYGKPFTRRYAYTRALAAMRWINPHYAVELDSIKRRHLSLLQEFDGTPPIASFVVREVSAFFRWWRRTGSLLS